MVSRHGEKFHSLFKTPIPVIAMLHLAGKDPVERALSELELLARHGVDAALVENYHCRDMDVVERVLEAVVKADSGLVIGVNILPNEWDVSLPLADKYGAGFVQLDAVAGRYEGRRGMVPSGSRQNVYRAARRMHHDVVILGGVWPKYYTPEQGSTLESAIYYGKRLADAIVVTGEGTGIATPLVKIQRFRYLLGERFPLVVGAGVNARNAYHHLKDADGVIVGSSLKHGNETSHDMTEGRVSDFMDAVGKVRDYRASEKKDPVQCALFSDD